MRKEKIKEADSVVVLLNKQHKSVEITWYDPTSKPSWQDMSETDFDPNVCVSRGYLLRNDEDFVTICMHLSASIIGCDDCGHVGDTFTLPKGCIVRMRFLKE